MNFTSTFLYKAHVISVQSFGFLMPTVKEVCRCRHCHHCYFKLIPFAILLKLHYFFFCYFTFFYLLWHFVDPPFVSNFPSLHPLENCQDHNIVVQFQVTNRNIHWYMYEQNWNSSSQIHCTIPILVYDLILWMDEEIQVDCLWLFKNQNSDAGAM